MVPRCASPAVVVMLRLPRDIPPPKAWWHSLFRQRARALAELQSPRFRDDNLQGFGTNISKVPGRKFKFRQCARARHGVRSFTSRNLRNSGPQSVCRQSPKSCAFADARARIGARSFTSRNLRNRGPQSLCQVLISHVPSPTHARIG